MLLEPGGTIQWLGRSSIKSGSWNNLLRFKDSRRRDCAGTLRTSSTSLPAAPSSAARCDLAGVGQGEALSNGDLQFPRVHRFGHAGQCARGRFYLHGLDFYLRMISGIARKPEHGSKAPSLHLPDKPVSDRPGTCVTIAAWPQAQQQWWHRGLVSPSRVFPCPQGRTLKP